MDVEQNKFFAFPGGSPMILSNEMFVWVSINVESLSKHDMYISSKDEVYFYAWKVVCKCCFNNHLHKHDFTIITLRYVDKGKIEVNVQRYCCPKCCKTYKVDLSDIVDKNANIAHELKEVSLEAFTKFFFSLDNDKESIDFFKKVNMSRQSIENIILGMDCSFEVPNDFY